MIPVEKAKRRMKNVLSMIGMLLLVPALLLFAFDRGALDRRTHQELYDALGSAQAAGVDKQTLSDIGDMLIDYLNGSRDDLQMTASVNGNLQLVFNEREISHMADVKALFDLERRLTAFLMALGLALLAAGLYGTGWARRLKRAALTGQLFWLSVLLFVGVWAAIDFDGLFRLFHRLLFNNDLWLLNPKTDLMIRMLPEAFFAAVAVRAAANMLIVQAVFAALWGLTITFTNRSRRKEKP
jgi:integral membrane protein (TIGR01906 family)